MDEAVAQFERAKLLHSTTGASLYGTDIGDWPARFLDAVAVLTDEENRVLSLLRGAANEK